jgi:hypothetical protein
MKQKRGLSHEFVELIPGELKDGVLYISIKYATTAHKCSCGCGNEVITPISPTDWKLLFDGETISLYPSIGNWNFPCQSHYWITQNKIKWALSWSEEEITNGRRHDKLTKEIYRKTGQAPSFFIGDMNLQTETPVKEGFWHKLKKLLS